jgi:hypothetical protein
MSRQKYFQNLTQINKDMGEADNVIFGVFYPDGGCDAEMSMTWHILKDEEVPRLEVFSDAFELLKTEKILRLIADFTEEMTPDIFSQLLIDHGFKDMSDNPLA